MARAGWKGSFVDAGLKRYLLTGKAQRSSTELKALMDSEVAALDKESSDAPNKGKEGEGTGSDQTPSEASLKESPDTSTSVPTDHVADRGPRDEPGERVGEPEETVPISVPSPAPKAEKLKRKKVWKKGQALRAVVTKTKKGSGRKKKGLSKEHKAAAKEYKRQARAEGLSSKPFGQGPRRTACRSTAILPEFVGSTLMVHNGKSFDRVTITDTMVGHKLGEFAVTRRTRHNLNRKKSKLTIRKKETVESTGFGPVSLSRIRDWSMDTSE